MVGTVSTVHVAGQPWSIFREGGGPSAALGWAESLLAAVGAPQTPGNIQFVYDWEVSEGGGGFNNPLNQGPVPGHPELTSTGQQFGGGAADFVSPAAGIQGAAAYLHMPNFLPILGALQRNDPAGARAALIASPWAASHYNGGSSFSSATVPAGLMPSSLIDATGLGGASTSSGVDTATLLKASVVNVGPLFKINLGAVGNLFQMVVGFGLVLFGANMVIKDLTGASPLGRTAEIGVGAVTGGKGGAALAAAPRRVRPAVKKVQARRRPTMPARRPTSSGRVPASKRLDAAASKTAVRRPAPRKAVVHQGVERRLTTGHKPRTEVGKRSAEFRARGGPSLPAPRASERRTVEDDF